MNPGGQKQKLSAARLRELIRSQQVYVEYSEIIPFRDALDIGTALKEYRETLEALQ